MSSNERGDALTPLTERRQRLIHDAFSDFFETPGKWKVDLLHWLQLNLEGIHRSAIVPPVMGEGVVTANIIIESFSGAIVGGADGDAVAVKGDIKLDRAFQILGWAILADQVGSIVIDIWKDVDGNYPPTGADSITGSAPPTLTADDYAESTTLTGWTTHVAAGDTLRFKVDSASTVTRVCLALDLRPL